MINIPNSLDNLSVKQINEILEAIPDSAQEYIKLDNFKQLVLKRNCLKVMQNIFGEQYSLIRDENLLEEICGQLITLTPNESAVIVYRYGLDKQNPSVHTLEQTATHFSGALSVSSEQIRQIEAKGFRKLRHPSRARVLAKFFMTQEQLQEQETARQKYAEQQEQAEKERRERISKGDYSAVKIEELNLSTRIYNGLKRAGVNTVEDLAAMSKEDLKDIRNLGKGSIDEIADELQQTFGIVIQDSNGSNRAI